MSQYYKLIFVATTITFALACTRSGKEYYEGDFNSEMWKSDSTGCAGIRTKLSKEIKKNHNLILGLNELQVKSQLGIPDNIQLYTRGQKFYIYPIACDEYGNPTKGLRIRFSALGFSNEQIEVKL